jgi:hypothetical protein
MTDLVRFVLVNTATGGVLGCVSALGILLCDAGGAAELLASEDRLIGLAMLVFTLGPAFAAGCLGTALAASADD